LTSNVLPLLVVLFSAVTIAVTLEERPLTASPGAKLDALELVKKKACCSYLLF